MISLRELLQDPPLPEPPWHTISEIATILGVNRSTVRARLQKVTEDGFDIPTRTVKLPNGGHAVYYLLDAQLVKRGSHGD